MLIISIFPKSIAGCANYFNIPKKHYIPKKAVLNIFIFPKRLCSIFPKRLC